MNKKVSAAVGILCFALLSVSVYADGLTTQIKDEKNFILGNSNSSYDFDNDGNNDVFDVIRMKHDELKKPEETTSTPAETTEPVIPSESSETTSSSQAPASDTYVTPFANGDICTIQNVGSGKMLNVHMGTDANDVNVYQWTADGSKEQTFKMNLLSDNCYMIRTMSSSDGTNRTLDIVKSNGNIVSGGNVDIYNPVDTIAQQWLFVRISDNKYKIVPKYNKSLALTANGNSNGTSGGTDSSSAGNVFVSSYNGSAYQQWIVTKN